MEIPGQPGLQNETLPHEKKIIKIKIKITTPTKEKSWIFESYSMSIKY